MPDLQSRVTGSWVEGRAQKDYYNNDVEVLLAEPEARTPSDSDLERRIVTEGWFLRLNGPLKARTGYFPVSSHLCLNGWHHWGPVHTSILFMCVSSCSQVSFLSKS